MNKSRRGISVRAPARVNLIGGHTDYNGGYVLPAALDLEITASARPRADNKVIVRAEDIGETAEFSLDAVAPRKEHAWINYIQGVAFFLVREGYALRGADISIKGSIPTGAGLSSSAALEVASALIFQKVSGFEMALADTALLCQRAENEFVGMRCGLMDQFACCLGRKGSALFLDCRLLEFERVPIDSRMRIVICNTGVRRELASSEYNIRRGECERAAGLLGAEIPGVKELRDVSPAQLRERAGILPEPLFKRARHVVSENGRVLRAAEALKSRDYGEFGRLLTDSHRSLRDDFCVSCPELDLMVELASGAGGVCGARMTGAGFGGCAVSLVPEENIEEFMSCVPGKYREKTGIDPKIYVCEAADGAGITD